MQITWNNEELVEAVTTYTTAQGVDLSNKKVEVTFIAGRGDKGYAAIIDITNVPVVAEVPVPSPIAEAAVVATPVLEVPAAVPADVSTNENLAALAMTEAEIQKSLFKPA